MEDMRPPHIARAVRLAKQIHDVEGRKEILVKERDASNILIDALDQELSKLWLQVGELKHATGESA